MVGVLKHKACRRQHMAHAPVCLHEASQYLQQRGLPAAVWPHQHVERAPRDLQAYVTEHLHVADCASHVALKYSPYTCSSCTRKLKALTNAKLGMRQSAWTLLTEIFLSGLHLAVSKCHAHMADLHSSACLCAAALQWEFVSDVCPL